MRGGGIPTWLTPKSPRVTPGKLTSLKLGGLWVQSSGPGAQHSPTPHPSSASPELALAGGQRGRTNFQPSTSSTPGGCSLSDWGFHRASLGLLPRAPVCSRAGLLSPLAPHHLAPALVFRFKLGTPCPSCIAQAPLSGKPLCSGPTWAHPPSHPALLHLQGRVKCHSSLLGPRGQASSEVFWITGVGWRKGGQRGCQLLART